MKTMNSDPSGLVGQVGAAVGALLALLIAFGIDLTEAQVTAILGVVATFGPLAIAYLIRRKAYAPDTVERILFETNHEPQIHTALTLERNDDGTITRTETP